MDSTLERFQIFRVHGRKNVDVVIRENTLVLVGENGSGKTTFLRILFHFLSGRWLSLVQFRFHSIVAIIGENEYKVTHDELAKAFKSVDRRFLAEVPSPIRRRVMELLGKGDLERVSLELERFGDRYSIPPIDFPQAVRVFRRTAARSKERNTRNNYPHSGGYLSASSLLANLSTIERELSSIFEGVDPEDFRRHRHRLRQNESGEEYIQLVEFGMKDVQQAVDRTLERLKEFARERA